MDLTSRDASGRLPVTWSKTKTLGSGHKMIHRTDSARKRAVVHLNFLYDVLLRVFYRVLIRPRPIQKQQSLS